MTNQDYVKNISRLKEIEAIVKDPASSLDNIDALIDEAKRLKNECLAFTRGLREKIESLDEEDNGDSIGELNNDCDF